MVGAAQIAFVASTGPEASAEGRWIDLTSIGWSKNEDLAVPTVRRGIYAVLSPIECQNVSTSLWFRVTPCGQKGLEFVTEFRGFCGLSETRGHALSMHTLHRAIHAALHRALHHEHQNSLSHTHVGCYNRRGSKRGKTSKGQTSIKLETSTLKWHDSTITIMKCAATLVKPSSSLHQAYFLYSLGSSNDS